MIKVMLSLFAVSAVLTLSVLGVQLYQGANMSQEAFALSQQVQTLKLQRDIADITRAKQQDAITYRLKAAKLKSQELLARSGMVATARELGWATLYLWPIACVLSLATGALLFVYSRRQTTIQEVEKARHSELIQTGEAATKAIEKAFPSLVRAALSAIPKQAMIEIPPVLDITPERDSLRAFSGNVHFSQACLDDDYEPGAVMLGRNTETGALCQLPIEDLQSLTIDGLQKTGKSVLLLSVIYSALCQKYLCGHNVTVVVVDIHSGLQDSLLTRLESFAPGLTNLFDRTFEDEDTINNELPGYLDTLIQQGKSRTGDTTLVIFDEYTETIANLAHGKEIEAKVKRLFNYRKAGIYVALAMFEAGKNSQSAKGLNVSKMSVSKALFRTAKDEGHRFMAGGSEAVSLENGEYLLLLPGMAEPERIKAPLFSAIDFQPFAEYLTVNAPQSTGRDKYENVSEDRGVTPEAVRTYLSTQGISQNMLAKDAGIRPVELSRYLHGKELSADKRTWLITTLAGVLFGPESDTVIPFADIRKRLGKQA